MPGAKRHTLPGSVWGQPCILGSPAWLCFWPLRSQHGLLHALSGSNPQVIISIFFVSDTLCPICCFNVCRSRIAGVCQCWTMLDTRLWFADQNPSPQTQCPSLERLLRWRGFLEMYQSHNIETPRTIIGISKWSQSSFHIEIQIFGICLFSRWVVSSSTVRWTLAAYNSPAAWAMRCRNF